jgi:uncharacterized Zn finger protein
MPSRWCNHVTVALYGAGARLDAEPELLFRLRAVDTGEIFANLDTALPASRSGAGAQLDANDLSDIFGIELAAAVPPPETKTKAFASMSTKPSPSAKISPSKAANAKRTRPVRPTQAAKAPDAPAARKPGCWPQKRSGAAAARSGAVGVRWRNAATKKR